MDCSWPGSSVHGHSPGRNTGVGCHAFLQETFPNRDQTQVSHTAGRFFTVWATKEAYTWWTQCLYFIHSNICVTYWKRSWCWEILRVRGEGIDRGWDGWIASPIQWTRTWANSGRQWRKGKPGMLPFMGLQSQTQLSDWTRAVDMWWCLIVFFFCV